MIRKSLILLFCLIKISAFAQNKMAKIEMEIKQNWQMHQEGAIKWYPASVPGTVHTDLLANKVIEDPYYRNNEQKQQWIDKVDWEYQTTFEVSEEIFNRKNIELIFYGLDTYVDVFLNGKKILNANNMFRTWKANCKNEIKKGQNIIKIYFTSPISIGLKELAKHGFPLPAPNDQSENGGLGDNKVSIFTRKAGYHYGWDWGPRFVTSGIWRPIVLEAWNDAIIDNIFIKQTEVNKNLAKLSAEFNLKTTSKPNTKLSLGIFVNNTKIAEKEIITNSNETTGKIDFEIKKPELWWSNGLGKPYLYNFEYKLINNGEVTDFKTEKIGLRTLRIVQKPDAVGDGSSFYFELNGVPVFAKGANYIPSEMFLPRINSAEYERIIKLAVDANMNMLRVWGGGVYEDDEFYKLCDQYGIIIWQDFMFACSMYPENAELLENIKQEAIDNVKRLRNHPCIGLWCGNNEIETAWSEYKEDAGWGWKKLYTAEQRKTLWNTYEKIFHNILPQVVSENTNNAFYWKSSPTAGDKKLSWEKANSGDIHYWGVWHGLHAFDKFKENIGRFMSEYGFQSFPEFNTVKKYTIPEDWDITSEVMASHQRSGIGNLRIKEYMASMYKEPKNFETFLYASHILQAEAIKGAIEAHRTKMPYTMGTLYWQLNDCWPVASWSSTDYYRNWKALHYYVRSAFTPVLIAPEIRNDSVIIFVVSDKLNPFASNISLKLLNFNGKKLWEKEIKANIEANTSKIYFKIPVKELIKEENKAAILLNCKIYDKNGFLSENNLYFNFPKDQILEKPVITKKIEKTPKGYTISVTSNILARNVYLSVAETAIFFSNNYFDILPGQTVKVEILTEKNIENIENKLNIISLTDCY